MFFLGEKTHDIFTISTGHRTAIPSNFFEESQQQKNAKREAPEMGSVWANRAQCWLKLGDHEKVLSGYRGVRVAELAIFFLGEAKRFGQDGEGWNWNYLDVSWMIDDL